jgi:hypothetical protein
VVTFSYSPYIVAQLEKLKEASEAKPDGEDATVYKAVRRQIDEVLPEPARCFSTQNLLKGIPNVATEYVGTKRWRLAYIVSQPKNLCVLLGIFYRKDNDKKDVYKLLPKMIRSGDFDLQFEEAGFERPDV